MDPTAPIDQYCERLKHGLFEEPLNLFTNLSFIIAGLLILKLVKKNASTLQRAGSRSLPILIIIIGIGSALFHSAANAWSMWADVIPIAVFVIYYLWLFLRHEAALGWGSIAAFFLGFLALSVTCATLSNPQVSNGGEWYFGTWISLFGISCFYGGRGQRWQFIAVGGAALLFSAALLFRTVDLRICDDWPTGTHFFWHLLNGVTLYLVTKAYLIAPGRS